MNKDILDWDEIFKQIPESDHPESAIQIIKKCFEGDAYDPYEEIDQVLNRYMENLTKSFQQSNK